MSFCTQSPLYFRSFVLLVSLLCWPGVTRGAESVNTLEGWLSVVWGDPPPGSAGSAHHRFLFTEDSGATYELPIDEATLVAAGGVERLNGQRVEVVFREGAATNLPLQVTAIRVPELPVSAVTAAVTGSQPWISVLCKFPDIATEPKDLNYFLGMYDNSPGRLDHYWREVSYDTIDIVGSTAVNWVTLPNPRSFYVPTPGSGTGANLSALFDDCTAAADPLIDFSNGTDGFKGINLMFNDVLDCCAWGGGRFATLDGVTKVWRVTWEPPWGYANAGVMGHEMGHGFGLPHSNNSDNDTNPYDSPWDVMSHIWSYGESDPVYGTVGKHTISYHKDRLGWISPGEIFEVSENGSFTITIDQLALDSTSNYRMARIPIDDNRYYTVEVRDLYGDYDGALPGKAVIIHSVNPSRAEPAWVVDADEPPANYADTEGVMWKLGEVFAPTASAGENSVSVSVDTMTQDGFVVTVDFSRDCPLPLGHGNYCRDCGPCAAGEGDCEQAQCAADLVCSQDVGANYGFPAHIDVCEAACPWPLGHGNYCRDCWPCAAGEGDCEHGQCVTDLVCSQNVGANYGFPAHIDVCEDTCPWPPGHGHYCRDCGPCAAGEGDCDQGECSGDLVCSQNVGANYGFPAHIDVCEDTCPWPLGHAHYCRDCGPCAAGEGDCERGECVAGSVCNQNVGANYGFPAHIDVCESS